jgi:hypothetical protein
MTDSPNLKGLIERLGNDAKSVAGAFFPTLDSRVTFHMEKSGPSARCQAGLDELVAGGLLSKEVHNKNTGAATYRPLTDLSECGKWHRARFLSGELERDSFNLYEPLRASHGISS